MDRISRGGTNSGLWKQDLCRPGLISALQAVSALSAAVGRRNVELKAVGAQPLAVPSGVTMWGDIALKRCVVDPVGAIAAQLLRFSPLRLGRGIQVG